MQVVADQSVAPTTIRADLCAIFISLSYIADNKRSPRDPPPTCAASAYLSRRSNVTRSHGEGS